MTFEYCNHLGDLELDKKEVDGIRIYKLPNDEWVPSITSVTSHYNREVFLEWRRKVGRITFLLLVICFKVLNSI